MGARKTIKHEEVKIKIRKKTTSTERESKAMKKQWSTRKEDFICIY